VVNEKFGIRHYTDVVIDTEGWSTQMTAMAQSASPLSVGSLTQLTLSLIASWPLIIALDACLLKSIQIELRLAASLDLEWLDQLNLGSAIASVLVRCRRRAATVRQSAPSASFP